MEVTNTKAAQLLAMIKRVDGPIKSYRIEAQLAISGEKVREIVSRLRCDGVPIGSDRRGYYWCSSRQQLQRTIDHLEGRANHLHKVISGLHHAFPDSPQTEMPLDANRNKNEWR